MNSVILLILLTFDMFIHTKYLLVEIPKIERAISYPEENEANEFVHYNKNESISDTFQSSHRLRPNGFSMISKASFGINNYLLIVILHQIKMINIFDFIIY